MSKENVSALEQAIAQSRAELTERVLKKLNQGATFREVEQLYDMSYADVRKFVSTMRVHMTVGEANFFRETAEHFGMLPNEALVHFGVECAKKAHATLPGASASPLWAMRQADVVQQVYDKMMGNRGNLYLDSPPAQPAASPDLPKEKTTPKRRKATKGCTLS